LIDVAACLVEKVRQGTVDLLEVRFHNELKVATCNRRPVVCLVLSRTIVNQRTVICRLNWFSTDSLIVFRFWLVSTSASPICRRLCSAIVRSGFTLGGLSKLLHLQYFCRQFGPAVWRKLRLLVSPAARFAGNRVSVLGEPSMDHQAVQATSAEPAEWRNPWTLLALWYGRPCSETFLPSSPYCGQDPRSGLHEDPIAGARLNKTTRPVLARRKKIAIDCTLIRRRGVSSVP
jgi:hypothetical protein